MNPSDLTCPECGSQLPEAYQARLCPACLLKPGFESTAPASGPGTAADQSTILLSDPHRVRRDTLADLDAPAKALTSLGLLESLTGCFVLLFIPWLGLLMLLLGGTAAWTGLSLRHGENAAAALTGCVLNLAPSPFWPMKLPFVIRVLQVLRLRSTWDSFVSVSVRKSLAWQAIRDVIRLRSGQLHHFTQKGRDRMLGSLPGREAPNSLRGVGARVGQFPQCAARTGMPVISTIRHPRTCAFVGWLFWSVAWSAYCLVVMAMAIETIELRGPYTRNAQLRMLISLWTIVILAWLLGTVILSRHTMRVCSARLSGRIPSRLAGARTALWASVAATGVFGLILMGIAGFDQSSRWSAGLQWPATDRTMLADLGLVDLMFGLICGLAAALLSQPAVRWVTRGLLVIAVLFPCVVAVVFWSPFTATMPLVVSFLPMALAIPAVLWALWATHLRLQEPVP